MADKTVVVRAVYRSNVAQGMRQDAGAITGFSAKVESSANKTVNSTKALGAASAVAGKLMVLGIGGAMAVSAKAAIDFESSLAGVAKTTDMAGNSFDRNSGPLFAFGEALRGLSLRTPINVNELAGIAEMGGQLGIAADELIGFTEVMAQVGVATNLSATEAAVGFARFANIMRTPQDEFERLASVVVELGNNLAATEGEILKFGTRIAPVARTVGATEEEVFALAGALTSLGIPAERGGTAIQKWMILAKDAVDSGGESLEKFARVAGMTGEEFQKLFKESPVAAFNAFAGGLNDINAAGGDLFGTLQDLQLGEVRTTQVLLAAAGGVDVLTDSLKMANAEGQEVTALQKEAALRFGTTASQVQLLGNSFRDLQIEVGNAVLGSGGLAFAVDVAREFFGILKDNLGTIQTMITIMGILVGLRIGQFFLTAAANAQAGIQAFKGVSTAVQGLNGTARIAQGGMLLLSGAMQGALGVAGLLAAAWAWQAVKAAELKAEIKLLMDEIEGGADPLDVFTDAIKDALSQEQIDLLGELGFGVRDLAEYLMDGEPAASELGQALGSLDATAVDEMTGKLQHTVAEIGELNEAAIEGRRLVEGFLDTRKSDLVQTLFEAGNAAIFTRDQMENLADLAIGAVGFDITDDVFLDWVRGYMTATGQLGEGMDHTAAAAKNFARGINNSVGDVTLGWQQYLGMLDAENAGQIIDDFAQGNISAVEDMTEALHDAFVETGEIVRGGMPLWEEYHKAVLGGEGDGGVPSYQAALESQRAFLEDTRDWIESMPSIMDMGASSDTVAWIESLETPIRGAIGRLNDAQLQELIDGANANFDELNKLHMTRWMQVYPENAKLAFGAMIGELTGMVGDMNLPGEQAAEAFVDGIMDMASIMPAEHQDEFLGYLAGLMENEEWMESMGLGDMGAYIEGLLIEAGLLAKKVIPALDNEFVKVKDHVDGQWGVQSPSKWWQNLGEQFTEGLKQGVSGMDAALDFSPSSLMPEMVAGVGSMSSVTNNRSSTYNLAVNSGSNSPNIHAEAQTLLTLLTIVGGVEGGAGR